MANRILLLMSLLSVTMTFGQDISQKDADSMINALKVKKQGIERIDLLLTLAQFHILKPGELQVDFDSAKAYMDEAAALNKSVNSSDARGYQILTESYLIKEKGQTEEGKKTVEKAIAMLETGTNKHYLGRAIYELSRYYGYEDPYERRTRIELIERAVNSFEQAGTLERNAYCLEMLGDLYALNKEYHKAIQILNRAVSSYNSVGHSRLQGVYILLGQSYQHLRDYAQALFYTLKALKIAQTFGDTSMQMCQINNSLGVLYNEIDNKDMAIKYLSDGLDVAKRYRDDGSIYWLAVNISVIYNNLGQSEKALKILDLIPESIRNTDDLFTKAFIAAAYLKTYLGLRQLDTARSYCEKVLNYYENNKVPDGFAKLANLLSAKYFFSTKQFQKARYHLTKNVELYKKSSIAFEGLDDSQLWYKLDSAQGNFQAALNHFVFYKGKMDSIFSVNKVRQLQVLEIEYGTAIKEDSIKAKDRNIELLTETNNLQSANLKQAGLIKNITIVGIILVLIILGLLYRQYLHKQKNNRVITQKNELLQQTVNEKEWLLKEIHHRVKNNLQIVMSLLNSQSVFIDNDAALTAIHDSQHRVHAISLIHQKLYGSDNVSSVDISLYIREMVLYLTSSFNTGQRIRFELDIEPMEMDVSQAVPLGLILNEAITNSIKYAFPSDRSGVIFISLSHIDTHQCELTISDNGIGIPLSVNSKRPGSLGMSLMEGLSKSLNGKFSIRNNNGTTINISFVHEAAARPVGVVMSPLYRNSQNDLTLFQ